MRKCLQRSSRRSNLTSTWFCSRAKMEYSTRPVRRGRTSESAGLLHLPVCKGHSLRGFALSIRLINAVVESAPVHGGEYLLLICMARYASDEGTRVFPAVSTLAKDTRQHERTVQAQLRSLEAKGLIRAVGRSRHQTVNYCIAVDKLSTGVAVDHPPMAVDTKRGVPERVGGGRTPPDSSSNTSLNRQNPETKINIKTEAGDQALTAISAFLPKFKSAVREKTK